MKRLQIIINLILDVIVYSILQNFVRAFSMLDVTTYYTYTELMTCQQTFYYTLIALILNE